MRRILALIAVGLLAGRAGAQEIEATVGVKGLKALPEETYSVRLVPDRSPGGAALTEEDLSHLHRFKGLRWLNLRGAGREAGPHGVGGSRWDLHLTDAGLVHIAKLRDLQCLRLPDHPEITESGLALLTESLPRLSFLTLRYWGAFGQKNPSRLVCLPAFTRLLSLDLSGCRGEHDREWPARIAALPNLSVLYLADCPWVREGGLRPILARAPLAGLVIGPVEDADLEPFREGNPPRSLVLEECQKLTSRGLAAVAEGGSSHTLNLHGCSRLESLAPLANHTGVQELTIRNARSLGIEGFIAIGAPPRLRMLRLAGCPKLDESVLASIAAFKDLTHLDLAAEPFQGTPQRYSRIAVTDAGLRHLVGLSKLRTLDLSGMKFTIYGPAPKPVEIDEPCLVTDEGLKVLAKIKSLRTLRLRHCPGITDEGVAGLQEALPDLRIER